MAKFIRQDIEEVAAMAGAVNFELPAPRLKGPSAADIEAASDMSAEDREDFIRSMVAQCRIVWQPRAAAPQNGRA